ncbi:MAG: type II toxin-antitoxin system VapC family toxin [Thermoplasmata archaeon]
MIYFFDTSALVKRYHKEKGTEFVDSMFEEIVNTEKEAFISSLSLLELTSALKRKQKGNIITKEEFQDALKTSFEEIDEIFTIIPVTEDTINESILVVTEFALKTLDSIQYQIVKEVGEILQDEIVVLTSDNELLEAFEKGGFKGIDPENADLG